MAENGAGGGEEGGDGGLVEVGRECGRGAEGLDFHSGAGGVVG